jgi:biofilm PGA synthesis lipoprotein PgaB
MACLAAPSQAPAAAAGPQIAILCYHDIADDPAALRLTVPARDLARQLDQCRRAGWTVVPLSELLARRDRPWELPRRTMVVTFDDGYRSFAERALPVLRRRGIRPTLAVVGAFAERPQPGLPPLLEWEAIAALDRAGEAEIASHSHDLHRWRTSNPQGDTQPALATRLWLGTRYENREEYRSRLHADLAAAQRTFGERLGRPAAVLAWPYGLDNEMAHGVAGQAGFSATLVLGNRLVTPEDLKAGRLPRFLVTRDMRFDRDDWFAPVAPVVRAAGIDLDDVYHPDERSFRARIDQVVARARSIGASHAIVDVCSDSAGRIRGSWFPGHQVAPRAEVWSMVAAKLSHAGLRVWARAPVTNLTWLWEARPEWRLAVDTTARAGGPAVPAWPTRLSPEIHDARRAVVDFFTDLAVYLPVDGILFGGDARVDAGERLAGSTGNDPAAQAAALNELIAQCRTAVRAWRPECRFGRVYDAVAAGVPGIDAGSSQDLDQAFVDGDLAVVALRPAASRSADPGTARRELRRAGEDLARRVVKRWKAHQGRTPAAGAAALSRRSPPPVLVELEARVPDDPAGAWASGSALAATLAGVRGAGIASLGIRPLTPEGGDLHARLLDGGTPRPAPVADYAGP